MSVDPVTTDANKGASFNRYVYANNSPYKYFDPDGRAACPGENANSCIRTDNFDQKKSNGQTTQASSDVGSAMVNQKGAVAVTDPGASGEKMGFVVPSAQGLTVQVSKNAVTTATTTTESASAVPPSGAVAVIHGHIDGVMSLVSPADASPLKQGFPNGVVSNGRVGVTEIVRGQLQFRMLDGKMANSERREQQKMLDAQQSQFDQPEN